MQTLRKKTSPCKYRNDPGRFFGDGVTFKAKLIGILEVGEARGDRMCQEALQDLKMAIRAAGEHKQRITIHVTIDGLRLRDEKTGDSLYHHPVHKISFIAQDMTDSRAFGYIFGSPDSGHRFFGIKTDKAASQVVLAMRDLFQVVFELKKKEIEMARQQIQSKTIHEHQPLSLTVKSSSNEAANISSSKNPIDIAKSSTKEMSPESVADLVDLEQELSSIQRGITQMERITPSDTIPNSKNLAEEDPFGDSFTNFPTYNLLPPPESSRSRHSKPIKPPDTVTEVPIPSFVPPQPSTSTNLPSATSSLTSSNWLDSDDGVPHFEPNKSVEPNASTSQMSENIQPQKTDAFTDLDPLGTGKSKPYVDKKYFFQELKNPPKKVLKDLSGQGDSFPATFATGDHSELADVFENKSDSFEISKSKTEPNPQRNFGHQNLFPGQSKPSVNHTEKVFNIDLERAKLEEPVMMPRDTDPFSPTRKKSDPFQDGDIFTELGPFEFEFPNKSTVLPETKIITEDPTKSKKETVFNGPLQVNLPPESWPANMAQKKIERQTSESPNSTSRNRPSVFKQNTVDVISSISSKKMPHLFGQKFSKRDSNSINMRRLQESDSLSENETAPEPPPRPESTSHIEPPPLPPKKQFSDIVIRPRITSSSAIPPPTRYDYVTAKMKANQTSDTAPPIPLPSRKVGRTDCSFPGPGRPGRKPGEEEDYLTPITSRSDVPPLLPPPQTKGRGRRFDHIEQKESEPPPVSIEIHPESVIPDITLSQLLTLGIDELAAKLNVPTTKLSTMTLVELTQYLSEFIENSKKKPPTILEEPPVFKVNFDQHSDATFVAKFDDNFGEEPNSTFVANFSNFEAKSEEVAQVQTTAVPPADRYAVLREIIEQDMKMEGSDMKLSMSEDDEGSIKDDFEEDKPEDYEEKAPPVQIPKIDTKITEAISHAKDRYAALRDIILVEDLFEKPNLSVNQSDDLLADVEEVEEKMIVPETEIIEAEDSSPKEDTSPESNQNFEEPDQINSIQAKRENKANGNFVHTLTVSNKDDLEIDELMNRAISNLSLDSRDHLSPNIGKSPLTNEITSASPTTVPQSKSPNTAITQISNKSQFNDVSTSPIPLQKSPALRSPLTKSPLSKSPTPKSPIPQSPAVANLIANNANISGSLSDVVCGSSPEAEGITSEIAKTPATPAAPSESWAVFDKVAEKEETVNRNKSSKAMGIDVGESPCSSDGKDEWKGDNEYGRRWPKGHTSSSSRDLSPWDDETPDYKKRIPAGADRHGYYMRHARRMNSCDDDYEYEEGIPKRRERKIKSSMNRSKENFDSDSQNWYQSGNHHNWSPPDDEERARTFERGYERGSYGPPYEKRDHKIPPHPSYDRRDHKNYDKRKYYREYSRPDYDFEPYGESPDTKDCKMMYYGENFDKLKCRQDYDYADNFGRDARMYKSREYFYERERKSFDRDSVESYESAGRRHKNFGSGEVYGSLDSREDFRERYMNVDKNRSLRKGMKIRGSEDYDQDSENDIQHRRGPGDSKSLQRPPQSSRMRKSSGSSPWDGEEPPPPSAAGQKSWKRPSSASESERRLAERRVLCHTLSGSDGEKDRRFRKKPRSRGKEDGRQQSVPLPRYPSSHREQVYDYMNYDEYEQPGDEDKFERLNRRRHDMHQRMMEAERRRKGEKYSYDEEENEVGPKYTGKKDRFYPDKERYAHKFDAFEDSKKIKPVLCEFGFDDFEDTPRSNTSSNKFNFEEHGFESDFNSPPPPTGGSSTTKSSYRFSNDFSEKEKPPSVIASSFDTDYSQTPTQKLRFDDKVTVSKFVNDQTSAFEDDFSKAEFVFENEDQWNPELKKNNNTRTKRHDNIKKSESVNIFARKTEDPFEDDDFFKSTSPSNTEAKKNGNGDESSFQWDNNFAKFDENM